MRKSFIAILGLITSASAFAGVERFVCDRPYGSDRASRYVVKMSLVFPAGSEGSRATLKVPGERERRKLSCAVPAVDPGHGGADRFRPLAYCNDGIWDAGYLIRVRTGGFAGLTIATVVAKNKFRDKEVAQLLCRSER